MSIVIIGAHGMLGREVAAALRDSHAPTAYDHPEIDIRSPDSVARILARHHPDWVINCAAYTDVDAAETNRDLTFAVNGDGPGILARACRDQGSRLCHISTDFIFDGKKQTPYSETDPAYPLSVYGQSKLNGELNIQAAFDDYLIIRTAWMFGRGGNNFVKTIRRLAAEQPELRVVDDQHGSPTSAADLAGILKVALEKNLRGIYHGANTGVCSWFDFAREIVALAGLAARVIPIDSAHMPRPARRPAYSALDCSRIMRDCGLEIRHWRAALQEYIAAA